jgi:3-phenylpropionate/trans-cinnamate dioxygenase ferredoxin reductase subunit
MPRVPPTFVIVGAGMAGAAAVQSLRQEGFDGAIVLAGDEQHPPYERPPLSKEYLRGEQGRDELFTRPAAWYGENDVDLRLGSTVESLDTAGPAVTLAGERLAADAVLLATGGRPRMLPGEPSERVLYLRRVEDADRIRAALGKGRVVIVGAGFIGAEVAASARTMGTEVTVLEMAEVPLHRALGEEMGRVYADIHRDHGVDLRTGAGVEAIEEKNSSVLVRTTKGDTLEAEAVVVGVGIAPNSELAEAAGLEVDNGIVVDERCRTSAQGIYACGDVANHNHPVFGRRIRVEHFDNALKMGTHVARVMLGSDEPFEDPHWFWSDQYDINLQYAGFAYQWDEMLIRGSVEDRNFCAFYLNDGILLACLGMNRGREVRRSMKLIAARARPDPAALRDEDVDLKSLVAAT